MYLINGLGALGEIAGSGAAGNWTGGGPALSVTDNGDGTRRIQWAPGVVTSRAPVQNLPQLARECGHPNGASPGIYPGLLQCDGGVAFFLTPGKVWQGSRLLTEGIRLDRGTAPIIFGNLSPAYWPDGWYSEPEPELPAFNGSACFYTNPLDVGKPPTEWTHPPVQGPCSGDPDSGAIPLLPGGGGDTPGYRSGTPSMPYRPWNDPNSPYYGYPTSGPVVDPVLPGSWDPWEPTPPTVDPDPVDDGEPPLSDPSRPYDPTANDPWNPTGGDPTGGDPGSPPPPPPGGPVDRGDRDPLPPTGDPSGPPPPPGTRDEPGGGAGGGAGQGGALSGSLWPLAALAALLLMRRR